MVLGLPDPEALSLAQQVAQMVVVRASGYLFDHQRQYPQWELSNAALRHCVETLGVGGVILLGGSAVEVGMRSRQLQSWAQVPLLIAADVEEGVGQRFAGATQFPPPMALSAIAQQNSALAVQLAKQMGAITAQEAIAIGVNWLLAPVVDVNNNTDNPVINVRAFGTTPQQVATLSTAFLHGAQKFPILTTAKHFPGHGDTSIDSHLHLPVISHGLEHLATQEIPPFRAAIAAGVDAVMTAHLKVPALDKHYPATLSPAILTRLLRQDLEFQGLVVTDALVMGAIAAHYDPYEAAILAITAGADVLLMPQDPQATIEAICEAVRIGRLTPSRILASVERIWRAKQKVGDRLTGTGENFHAWEHLPPPPVQLESLAMDAARAVAAQVAQQSQEVRGCIPICPADQPGQNLLIVDDPLNAPWLSRTAPAISLPAEAGYSPKVLDAKTAPTEIEQILTPPKPTLVQLFSRGNPFRGNAGFSEIVPALLSHIQHTQTLSALIVYGSPFNLETITTYLQKDTPYGFSYGLHPESQFALLSEMFSLKTSLSTWSPFTD